MNQIATLCQEVFTGFELPSESPDGLEQSRKYMIPLDVITLSSGELRNESSLIAAYAKQGEVVSSAETKRQ